MEFHPTAFYFQKPTRPSLSNWRC